MRYIIIPIGLTSAYLLGLANLNAWIASVLMFAITFLVLIGTTGDSK